VGKHALKLFLRRIYARALFFTGLHAVVNRLMPRRMTILFGHCVDEPAINGFLPADMKIRAERLERILAWLARRYDMVTIGEGLERLERAGRGRSLVALSMDDGYRDNRTALPAILARTGARATVFLATGPVSGGGVDWSHKLFWMLARGEPIELLARRYLDLTADEQARAGLRRALEGGGDHVHAVKRVLKYDADPDERERVIDALFRAGGGDEAELRGALYMTWDDARALLAGGIEFGGHTMSHHVLSTLPAARQAAEIRGCTEALERELGVRPRVFAYPFGRRWDYDAASKAAVRDAGYAAAVNTHAGTNARRGLELARLALGDGSDLALLAAEACGGFDLLRRVGIDLSA
jgi:peptidoglycan/xylan/chitin deacetylase (PgdA/CDA1 family)